MAKSEKTLEKVMSGKQDRNINFNDLRKMLKSLGFGERINGDHFILWYNDLPGLINIQPEGNKAKEYQVRQIREFLLRNNIVR